jgi:hypothetical protein
LAAAFPVPVANFGTESSLPFVHVFGSIFMNSSALVGLDAPNTTGIDKLGTLHRACWIAKAIYSMKIELLYNGNEMVMCLTARELQGLQHFNRFVASVYIQSWFTAQCAADAPFNYMDPVNSEITSIQ